jgi:hypothetical protein
MIDESGRVDKTERISEISKELEAFLENSVEPELLKRSIDINLPEPFGKP